MKKWLDSIDYKPIIKPIFENIEIKNLKLRIEKQYIKSISEKFPLLNSVHNNNVYQ